MHNDEAVNAIKFGKLWEGSGYKYDPNEHHGPSLYYATVALAKLTVAVVVSSYVLFCAKAPLIVRGLAVMLAIKPLGCVRL